MLQTENSHNSTISLSNFSFMDNDTLKAVRSAFSLTMSLPELRACQTYYRTAMHRDPRAEELQLLDRTLRNGRRTADSFLVAEMETVSRRVADTFGDLMHRRRDISPALDRPISLGELSAVMENYLASDDRTNPLSNVAVRFNPHRELLMAGEGYIKCASTGTRESDVTIGYRPQERTKAHNAAAGDYVFAILNTHDPDPRLEAKLTDYLASAAVRRASRKTVPLLDRCLLSAMAETADGLELHTDKLTKEDEPLLNSLTAPVFGFLIVASPSESADMLILAGEMGISIVHAATVTASGSLRIPLKNGSFYSFHTAFLRSLTVTQAYAAKIEIPSDSELDVRLSRIGTCTLDERKHAVVKTDSTGDDPYAASLFGILYALLHCFAAGAAPSRTGLSCRLTLPLSAPSASRVGESVAAILGMYRMQAEFELFGNAPSLEIGDCEHPTLSAVTVAPLPRETVPSTVVGNGSSIFYLEPLYTEEGLPDFDDLRKMLTYLEKLNRDGHIRAMLPTGGDLLAALGRMSGETTVEYVRRDPLESHIGGMLVETDIHIQGALVAVTNTPASLTTAAPAEEQVTADSPAAEK